MIKILKEGTLQPYTAKVECPRCKCQWLATNDEEQMYMNGYSLERYQECPMCKTKCKTWEAVDIPQEEVAKLEPVKGVLPENWQSWKCSCGQMNTAFRNTCYKCNKPLVIV